MRQFDTRSLFRRLCLLACIGTLLSCQTTPENTRDAATVAVAAPNPAAAVTSIGVTAAPINIITPVAAGYDDLWQRMQAGFQLGDDYAQPEVVSRLQSYTGNQRYFDLVTERAAPFLYWIVEEIDRRHLPQELALVPIVESTFDPNAYSREHAVGLWQFMGATGKSFGLQQDWWYDARREPQAATIAALNYLQILYDQFDENWMLALAAYNTGDGNLRRAIRNSGQEAAIIDFWSLPLARETHAHVAKILALAKIISDSEAFGVELRRIPNSAALSSVEIGAQINIAQAAELAQIGYAELRALNPGYLQWATHPDHPQTLLLPPENAEALLTGLQTLHQTELPSWDRYQIAAGDTLGGIARRLGTRVDILQTVNQIQGSQIIAGRSLLIPRLDNLGADLSLFSIPSLPLSRRAPMTLPASHRVRRGDNLWSIARRYDLRSRDIASWNQIELDSILQLGQILDLSFAISETDGGTETPPSASEKTYLVRSGDSMARIAARFNTSLEDLLLWNSIDSNHIIYPGQLIQISPLGLSELN
jgi:membrane-bound lytic murein transglycosylase D